MSWIIRRGCIYIMYCNYTVNTNPTKDISVAKTQLITMVETICREYNTFRFNAFKLELRMHGGRYTHDYPSYASTYFLPLELILAPPWSMPLTTRPNSTNMNNPDKELFLTKFTEWVNRCDDLFVIYLYLLIFETRNNKPSG